MKGKNQCIGITGGIACGKSTVGRILREAGVPVCETDEVAHAVMQPGGPAYGGVVDRFGPGICRPDGTIDRRLLGVRVFAAEGERQALNALVHPHVRRTWLEWVAARQSGASSWVAVIIPLLYEVGAERDVDVVWCVAAPPEEVAERLRQRGLNPREMAQRLAAQWPLQAKRDRADYVIENTGSEADLRAQVRTALHRLEQNERKQNG